MRRSLEDYEDEQEEIAYILTSADQEIELLQSKLLKLKSQKTYLLNNLITGRIRTPEIMSEAAYVVLTRDAKSCTGNFFIDEDVLREAGVADFDQYAVSPNVELLADFFV